MFLLKWRSNKSRIRSTSRTKKHWNTTMLCHLYHIKYDSIKSLNVLIPLCNFINVWNSTNSKRNWLFILWFLSNDQFVHKLHHIFKWRRDLTSWKNVEFFRRKVFMSSFEVILFMRNELVFIRYFIHGIILR